MFSAVQNLVSSEKLMERYPDLKGFREDNPMVVNAFLGIIPALIWTCFFAYVAFLCNFRHKNLVSFSHLDTAEFVPLCLKQSQILEVMQQVR